LWRVCYVSDDCDVQKVMDGLNIDRGAVHRKDMTKVQRQQEKDALRAGTYQAPHQSPFLESERISLDDDIAEVEEGTEIELLDSNSDSEGED
jgi:hypothetical protein